MNYQEASMTRVFLFTTEDAEAWRSALPTDSCVMGSLEYVRIQERQLRQSARLFVAESQGARVAYPFFLRPIPENPLIHGNGRWDTATPDYTGPVLLSSDPNQQVISFPGDFQTEFNRFCLQEGIVAEFAHLNPWKVHIELLNPGCIEANREIVYIDLSLGETAIWKQSLSSDARRQTRQAMDAGVRARRAESIEDVLAFHCLHHQTMERRSAKERYFLPEDYFVRIFETMPENAFYMLSEYQGKIIAGGLYFQDATDVYWHLSAFDFDFSRVRPVNAFHFETIKATALAGKKRLLCGGAHQPGDGVYRFKAGFSPLRVQFNIYKRIHAPDIYAAMTEAWAIQHPGFTLNSEFFPAYRSEFSDCQASENTTPPEKNEGGLKCPQD